MQTHRHIVVVKDLANPETAAHINIYPEDTDGPRSETWQFSRWKEVPPDQLTPSYFSGTKRFWVDEIAQLHDGRWIIPVLWIKQHGELQADCRLVLRDHVCYCHFQNIGLGFVLNIAGQGLLTVVENRFRVPVSELLFNYNDICAHGQPIFSGKR
jgi:hypothetical protein